MRHSDPSASITVWLRSCRLICMAPPAALDAFALLARFHPLQDFLANHWIALRHHHDRGVLFHRETLVGDGLYQRLIGIVHQPLLVRLVRSRLNLLCIVLLHVGNLIQCCRCCVKLVIRDALRRLRRRGSRRLFLCIRRGNRGGEDHGGHKWRPWSHRTFSDFYALSDFCSAYRSPCACPSR